MYLTPCILHNIKKRGRWWQRVLVAFPCRRSARLNMWSPLPHFTPWVYSNTSFSRLRLVSGRELFPTMLLEDGGLCLEIGKRSNYGVCKISNINITGHSIKCCTELPPHCQIICITENKSHYLCSYLNSGCLCHLVISASQT